METRIERNSLKFYRFHQKQTNIVCTTNRQWFLFGWSTSTSLYSFEGHPSGFLFMTSLICILDGAHICVCAAYAKFSPHDSLFSFPISILSHSALWQSQVTTKQKKADDSNSPKNSKKQILGPPAAEFLIRLVEIIKTKQPYMAVVIFLQTRVVYFWHVLCETGCKLYICV